MVRRVNMENYCTCKDISCKYHPLNHNQGCTPCIVKNLKQRHVPNCYFNLVTEDKSKIKGYSIQDFAHLVIESENQS